MPRKKRARALESGSDKTRERDRQAQQPYEIEEQFRARLRATPVFSLAHSMPPSPFARDLQRKAVLGQIDCMGMLIEIFSPERFAPLYWERSGLPDIAREWEYLGLPARVKGLRGVLTDDEFERLRQRVNEAARRWMRWRGRAVAAGIETVRGDGWLDWWGANLALKSDWDEIGEWIDHVYYYLCDLTALIEGRRREYTSGPGVGDTGEGKQKNARAHDGPMMDDDTFEVPALDDEDLKILRYLAEQGICKVQVDIEQGSHVSRKTVGKRLSCLREVGLIKHPPKKKGYMITSAGRQVLQRLPVAEA